jgi:hypothetical protein
MSLAQFLSCYFQPNQLLHPHMHVCTHTPHLESHEMMRLTHAPHLPRALEFLSLHGLGCSRFCRSAPHLFRAPGISCGQLGGRTMPALHIAQHWGATALGCGTPALALPFNFVACPPGVVGSQGFKGCTVARTPACRLVSRGLERSGVFSLARLPSRPLQSTPGCVLLWEWAAAHACLREGQG